MFYTKTQPVFLPSISRNTDPHAFSISAIHFTWISCKQVKFILHELLLKFTSRELRI